MSENVTYLPVRDFKVVRIVCHHQGCGAAFELPPEKVEEAMKKTNVCCPLCSRPFVMQDALGGADVITMMAQVIIALNKLAPSVRIELPLPID